MSITTDFGCEVKTLEMRDCAKAYCFWMAGASMEDLSTHVTDERWLPNAIRLAGWSHTLGNISKQTVESYAGWPRRLEQVRAVVSFLHNTSWRRHIKRALGLDPPEGLDLNALDHFDCQIAKWRYETVAVVFAILTKLMPLLRLVRQEWFVNAQDKESLKSALDALHDPELHIFLEVTSREVFTPVEEDRHWGMIYECPQHKEDRARGVKHIACWWNSRRLPHAWEHIQERMAAYRARATSIRAADCGGNNDVRTICATYLRKVAAFMKQRMTYLSLPPWSFATVGSVAGAGDFMEQVRSREWTQHDPVTRQLVDRLGAHIDARARGEDLHPDLVAELLRFSTCPLDESAGEGVHRSTTREKRRAVGSTVKHLKTAARRKGAFAHIKEFRSRYGRRGAQVLRFEMTRWKRILQCSPKRQWQGVKRTPRQVYGRVYREDEYAEQDWNNAVSREAPVHPVQHERATQAELCRNEYLVALLEDGRHYSVPAEVAEQQEDGTVSNAQRHVHFEVVQKAYGQHRAHVMPTVATPHDPSLSAALAVEVVVEEIVPETESEPAVPGTTCVFVAGDSEWRRPSSIAPFLTMQQHMVRYNRVERGAAEGTLVLADGHTARIPYAIWMPSARCWHSYGT